MAKPKMPNWAQTQLQNAAGLGELELTVVFDDEARVQFQGLYTRDTYTVEKRDGRVRHEINESKVRRNGDKRVRPAGGTHWLPAGAGGSLLMSERQ